EVVDLPRAERYDNVSTASRNVRCPALVTAFRSRWSAEAPMAMPVRLGDPEMQLSVDEPELTGNCEPSRQWDDAAGKDRERPLVKRKQDGGGNRCAGEAYRAGSGESGQDAGETEDMAGGVAAVHDVFLFLGFLSARGGISIRLMAGRRWSPGLWAGMPSPACA